MLGLSVLLGEEWLEAGEFGRGVPPLGVVSLTMRSWEGLGPMR